MIVGTKEIEAAFAWSAAIEKDTARGARLQRKAKPSPDSDRFFAANRPACAAAGVVFGEWPKGSGTWSYTWWQELPPALIEKKMQARADSRATDADVEIPCRPGLSYMPFQKAGIKFMRGRMGVLLADEMGLGKTIQIIGKINDDPKVAKVLIIVPAHLTLNWVSECQKWLVRPMSIGIVDGKCFPTTDIVIIAYSMLQKWEKRLGERHWDLIAADEVHYVKNPKAIRSKVVLGYKPRKTEPATDAKAPLPARHRIFATGTPICNRPQELWGLVSCLDPVTFNSWWTFMTKYAGLVKGEYGMVDGGRAELESLQCKLRESCMIRRLKKDVLVDLPPKTRQLIPFEAPASVRLADRKYQSEFDEDDEEAVEEMVRLEIAKASENPEDYAKAVSGLGKADAPGFTELAKLCHDTAVAMIPFAIEHITDLLESGTDKLVVWAHHHDVLDGLAAGLQEFGVLLSDGRASVADRQSNVVRFQNDRNAKVHVCGIKAMGTGHTMTAASTTVFVELDWVPGNVSQAEDRLHRIGQKANVLVQHLVFAKSIYARIASVIVSKQEIIARALDIKSVKETGPIQTKAPDWKAATEHRVRAMAASPIRPAELREDSGMPVNDVDRYARKLTPELCEEIHACLRSLAGSCDGARKIDGAGFSKFDARLGQDLAGLAMLSPRSAAIGLRLVTKYQRQLGAERVKAIYDGMERATVPA